MNDDNLTAPLTAARLREIARGIMASRGWGDRSVTAAEDAEIKAFWRTLPGSYSYYGAVCALAEKRGRAAA